MPPLATVGILSIGEMGMGVAKLLIAHNYRVVTNIEGRSADTHARVESAKIESLPSDSSLVSASDYILSIVPPRDALATAHRIKNAISSLPSPKPTPLYYLDLNAISPRSVREIATLFSSTSSIKLVDGGIIGGPPSPKDPAADPSPPPPKTTVSNHPITEHAWNRPSIPTSGPNPLASAPISGEHLASTLNARHISDDIGPASGLKCCFASTTKGFTALCLQSFTTASNLGVFEELQKEMETRIPGMWKSSGSMAGMPPKAYRWVKEMEEIAVTHAEDGGFEGGAGLLGSQGKGEGKGVGIFDAVAEVYRAVAEDTILGEEKTERRKRGRTREDVAAAMGEGLREKKKKVA
ncbi:6-phosphogluconate dehydrogenase C-terminal domain-like protein [Mollisia scopiformis]|uniref:6-phosphogluconate dehydrogenase C-terminal domain-like protein n=1 Tax=Mollisia scopiformis TaxID=149040 RepID=A0A194XT28_MOLSC|nr:6-phosphogluconate dehydrogenase C-terminal domain-like protein [Mollisia scopiformis]KUJ22872.1 6-phosphogluconate dehydrogenase C-terminal domain-like protein [Mollisia scopiformis]